MTQKPLDLDAVRAFVLTAQLQSFTRAAEALDSTQSAISLRLRRLEAQLGRRLLERTPRRVQLSAEGAAFLGAARQLLEAHAHAWAALENEPRRLGVGISQLLVGNQLPWLLRQFGEHDPELRIELHVAGSRELLEAQEQGRLDAVILVQPSTRPPRGSDLLFAERFGWFAAAGWQPRPGEPLPLATQGEGCSIRGAAVQALDRTRSAWTEVFIGKGAATIGAAAVAGLAIAPLARRAAPAGTIDVGPMLGLPALPRQQVVLKSALNDRRSREALRRLGAALRSMAATD